MARETQSDETRVIPALLDKAYELQVGAQWPQAIELLDKAVELSGSEFAQGLIARGVNQRMVRNFDRAWINFDLALTVAEEIGDTGLQIEAYASEMDLARATDQKELAYTYRSCAYDLVIKLPSRENLPTINFLINDALLTQKFHPDELQKALAILGEAEALCQTLQTKTPRGNS